MIVFFFDSSLELDRSNFKVCYNRKADWANILRTRSDLHAADARYHNDCRKTFIWGGAGSAASRKETLESISSDKGFESVKKLLENNCKNMWTSVGVYNYYTECSGLVLSRQGLVAKLANEFGKDLVILSSPELANTLVFRTFWYSEVMPR